MTAKKIERVSPRQGYDIWSEAYDSTPNPVVAMDSRCTMAMLSPQPGELILDAGCGTGRNYSKLLLAGSTAIGIDFSYGMLTVARRKLADFRADFPVLLADLECTLPFESASFDAVLCALIGEHLSNLGSVLKQFYRVLKPGGRLVFSVYHPEMAAAGIEANFEQEGVEYRLGAFHYTVGEHQGFLAEAGFVQIVAKEFSGDEELVRSVPSAAKYVGFPILLVLTATKQSP
jgi:ubiquinone/menaquinone biosynthesis C-methylase UbiE